jgi:hypothetical protein
MLLHCKYLALARGVKLKIIFPHKKYLETTIVKCLKGAACDPTIRAHKPSVW